MYNRGVVCGLTYIYRVICAQKILNLQFFIMIEICCISIYREGFCTSGVAFHESDVECSNTGVTTEGELIQP